MLSRRALLGQLGAAGLLAGINWDRTSASASAAPRPEDDEAGVVTAWVDLLLRLVQNGQGFTPPVAARAIGYFGVTVYEAVVPGSATHRTLHSVLANMPMISGGRQPIPAGFAGERVCPTDVASSAAVAPATAHWPLAANAAAGAIVRSLFPRISADDRTLIEDVEAANRTRYTTGIATEIADRSERFGRAVAAEVFAWSMSDGGHDGFLRNGQSDYQRPEGRGLWVPTPPAMMPALQPRWGSNRCLAVAPSMCPSAPNTPYDDDPGSAFYAEAMEVVEAVNGLTAEQEAIARFWSDDPGSTPTPPGHSLSIANQVIGETQASLMLAAETYAKVGIAVNDAFVCCWADKYRYNLLRPVTFAQRHIDPQWMPLLVTPPFPEHPSGHSVQSGAAFSVLADLFGDGQVFTDRTHDARGLAPRTFESFSAAAEEAAISRLYGGIHFRPAIDLGLEQGRCIGDHINALALRL
jgi:hypothetical protein